LQGWHGAIAYNFATVVVLEAWGNGQAIPYRPRAPRCGRRDERRNWKLGVFLCGKSQLRIRRLKQKVSKEVKKDARPL
jgi:hypothetical protein